MSDRTLAEAHILVVDDEASIVRLFARALESAGYVHVHGTTDPTEVPALLGSLAPDLVVMDLNMPGLDGFALLEEISGQLSQDTFLPVLTVSGMSDPEAKERAFRAGARDYLVKPISIQELLLHVNSLLETRFLSLRLHETHDRLAEIVGRRTEELQVSVSQRAQAEEALLETERHFQEVRRLTRLGTWDWDIATDTVSWSPELFDIAGVDQERPAPSFARHAELFAPESYPRLEKAVTEALESGTPYEVELEMLRPDGTSAHVLVRGGALRDETGRVVRLAGTLQDVTERWQEQRELADTLERLRESEATIIRVLSSVVDRRDPYTAGHQRRVADISVAIARRMGLSEEQVQGVETAALLHDIGKITIPLEILSIPGPLSRAQHVLVQEHAYSGYELLSPVPLLEPVAKAVLQHHERLDGSGYPAGIKGEEIILEARILAVADVAEAMTSHRPYRPALASGSALAEIAAHRETLYDGAVVDAYLEVADRLPDPGATDLNPDQLRLAP
jgi:PAS domain S-box-containing protein/putative nucleotidyltransferase with HDIG domain